jgi:2-polyprenyl-3-methyl-5-hydroxy-6-metoxy-1,4-benzoquinol methylase
MKDRIPGNYQYHALRKGHPIQKQWHRNKLNLIRYLRFLNENDVVLDAGCGSGNMLLEFAKEVRYIVGIDTNEECIRFLKQKIKDHQIQNAFARKLDLLQIRSLNLSFSKIIMSEVIEHLNEEYSAKILRELGEIITRDGEILITTPNYRSLWSSIETLLDSSKLAPKLKDVQHVAKYDWRKLLEIAEQSNYQVIDKGTLNWISPFISLITPNLADKISYFEFSRFPFGNLLYVVLRRKIP